MSGFDMETTVVERALDEADARAHDKERREYLTCRLGEETYGIDILQVQEIREIDTVTRVPHVAPYVRGVINLRGAIVPVVDVGLMFGFPKAIELKGASAIVLQAEGRLVGFVVDAVSDVVALADDEIAATPELGGRAIGQAITGIGSREGLSVLLMDVPYVLKRVREDRA